MVTNAQELSAPIVDLEPRSAYEVLTREKVEHFADEIAEIRHRINTIFYLVIGGLLMDLLMQWL